MPSNPTNEGTTIITESCGVAVSNSSLPTTIQQQQPPPLMVNTSLNSSTSMAAQSNTPTPKTPNTTRRKRKPGQNQSSSTPSSSGGVGRVVVSPSDYSPTSSSYCSPCMLQTSSSDQWFSLVQELDRSPKRKITNIFQQASNDKLHKLYQQVTVNKETFANFWNNNQVSGEVSQNLIMELSLRLRSILYDSFVTNHVLFDDDISLMPYIQMSEFHTLEKDRDLLENLALKDDENINVVDLYKYNQIEQMIISNLYSPKNSINAIYDEERLDILSKVQDASSMVLPMSDSESEQTPTVPSTVKPRKKIKLDTDIDLDSESWNIIDTEMAHKVNSVEILPAKDLETYLEIKEKLQQENQKEVNRIDIFDREERWNLLTAQVRLPNLKLRGEKQTQKCIHENSLSSFYFENLSSNNRCIFPEYTYDETLPDYGESLSNSHLASITARNYSKDFAKQQSSLISNLGYKLGLRDVPTIKKLCSQSQKTQEPKVQHLAQTILKNACNGGKNILQALQMSKEPTSPLPGKKQLSSSSSEEDTFIYSPSNTLVKQNVDKIIQLREKKKNLLIPLKSAIPTTESSASNSSPDGMLEQNLSKENVHAALSCITSMILCHEGFEGVKSVSLNILTDILESYIDTFGNVLSTHISSGYEAEEALIKSCEEMFGRNISVADLYSLKSGVVSHVNETSQKLSLVELKLTNRTHKPKKQQSAPKTKLLEIKTAPKLNEEDEISQLTSPSAALEDISFDFEENGKKRNRDIYEEDISLDELENLK